MPPLSINVTTSSLWLWPLLLGGRCRRPGGGVLTHKSFCDISQNNCVDGQTKSYELRWAATDTYLSIHAIIYLILGCDLLLAHVCFVTRECWNCKARIWQSWLQNLAKYDKASIHKTQPAHYLPEELIRFTNQCLFTREDENIYDSQEFWTNLDF